MKSIMIFFVALLLAGNLFAYGGTNGTVTNEGQSAARVKLYYTQETTETQVIPQYVSIDIPANVLRLEFLPHTNEEILKSPKLKMLVRDSRGHSTKVTEWGKSIEL